MRDFAPVELKLGGVGTQLGIGLAAEQLIHRNTQGLAADIPQGDVDARHAGHDDTAVAHAPEREAMQAIPNLLIVHGIETENALGEIDRHAKTGTLCVAIRDTHLAEARDALIGVDADEHGMPRDITNGDLSGNRGLLEAANDLDARDFHGNLLSYAPQYTARSRTRASSSVTSTGFAGVQTSLSTF